MLIVLLSLAALPAHAAEVTDLPPMLRGDVEVRFDLSVEDARLVESGETVGKRRIADNQLVYAGTLSVYDGLALFFELPHGVGTNVSFGDAREMVVDADFGAGKEAGTMLGSDPIEDPPVVQGSGLEGTWVGIRGAPFSRDLFPRQHDSTSWLLELGYRFKDKSNFWTVNDAGKRGAGPGAPAFRFHGAWSTRYRASQPYVTTTLVRTGRITTDVADASGQTTATGLVLRPASSADLGVGSELVAGTYGEGPSAGQVGIDCRLHFGYVSWQDIPSGLYLPSVLDLTTSQAATESEYAYVRGGLGVNWRIVEYVQLNLGGDVGTSSPRRIEHAYPVYTGMGTLDWQVHALLRFRARDPLFD